MTARLAGRRVLVTGATGGIGAVIARALLTEGAAVAALAREPDRLPVYVDGVVADVRDAAGVARAVDEAAALLGGLDALVLAAAVDCVWAPTAEMSVETWDETIAVNLSGAFYTCRAALRHLTGGGGAVVALTSVAGERVWAEDVAYSASKAGLELLVRTIAVEYADRGIRANCVAPGVIDAGMTDAVTEEGERRGLAALHPLGRLGRAEEVAEAVVWLLSDASSFTTGTTIAVDGGFLARP